jgi:hypothetical protein
MLKKKSKRVVSFLVVIVLVLSGFSAVASAFYNNNKKIDTNNLNLKSAFKEKIEDLKEKIQNFKNQLNTVEYFSDESDIQLKQFSLYKTMNLFSIIKTGLEFYTNYNGNEKTDTLRLFRQTKIDLNDDSKDDIVVLLQLYPGIESSLALSINYKISINQLSGFDDLDKNAYFKAMSELNFPGILSKNLTDDKLEFGYESAEGENIPEKCSVTYKLVPHIFSIKKTPDHIFAIDTDAVSEGSAKLNLIFGFTEADDRSEVFSKVSYDPVVSSEITFKRSRGSGVSFFEYERTVSSQTNVDLYLAHIKGENKTYAYALDLPSYVGFSLRLGQQGKAEFSTDSAIAEIGLCDNIDNPKNKVYFSDMFTTAILEWNRDPFLLLKQGSFNASIYTEGAGVSFNIHLEGDSGGNADFSISPDATVIDASLELDLSEGYFRINRNEFDLFVSFSISVLNESISSFLSTLSGSFNIARLSDGPFEIFFDDLYDGELEIYLSGKSFELYDVDITGFSEIIGGNFSVSMDSLIKETYGFISFSLSVEKQGNNITGICRFEIDRGAEIENLLLKFNNFVFARESISTSGSVVKEYPFSICVSIVEWHVASDLSSGYIVIKSNSSAILSFNSTYSDESGVVGRVSGTIQFKTTSDLFNVSWEIIDANTSFNINGSALVGLSDFYLWIKDKAEISIPEISINFELNTVGKTGSLMLHLNDNMISANVNIENINITDLFDITLKGSLQVGLDATASGVINIAWNESGVTSIDGDFEADATGFIDITDFEFRYKTLVDISMSRLFINGGLNVNFSSIDGNISLYADVDLTDIIISDLSVYSSISQPLGVSADMDITFDGNGKIEVLSVNDTVLLSGQVIGNSNILINSLWFVVPVPTLPIELNVEALYIDGSTTIEFDVDISQDTPFMITIISENEITAGTIYLGYPGVLQIFVYDFVGGGTGGSVGLGLNMATSQPVFDFDHSSCFIGDLNLYLAGILIPMSNLSINGTAQLEGFLDIAGFTYVYLRGTVEEETIITVENVVIPILNLPADLSDFSLVLKPGEIDFLLQNTGDIYLFGYSSSWITIKANDKELVKLIGALNVWFSKSESSDGTKSFVIDAKEVSGVVILADSLRFAGKLNAHIEFSININKSDDTTTYSDLYLNVSGEISAVVQVKGNDTDWIPISPFNTSGQVILLCQASFMNPPDIADEFITTTNGDNKSLGFEVWYAPPIGESSASIGPFTYNVSFDDGTYYEETTDNTRIVTGDHIFNLGSYNASVIVTPSDSSVAPIYDVLSFEVIKKIAYLEISENGPLSFTYDDVEGDGRIHTWFTIRNKAEENYNLEWEAAIIPALFDSTGMDPIVEPEMGILGPQETVRVNTSFYPPLDHKEHSTIYFSADNINYTGYGGDGAGIPMTIKQSLTVFPSSIYLPDLSPGEQKTSSIWIHNNKAEALGWSITNVSNDNYSFQKTDGTILPGGAETVYFTVNAPNEEDANLAGIIEVTDIDDPVNVAEVSVHVGIQNPSLPGNGNVTVTEEGNGNVSIAIGGSNEIHLNNFQTDINGVIAEINGHFIFDTNESYIYINFTKGNIGNFSVEGSADFTVDNFRFKYGDNITIEISKVITGGIHWRKGRSGNLTIYVDDTFTDVDIDINLNIDEYTNFSVAGNFDIDIDGQMDGTIWFDWDFNDGISKNNLSIGGDLFGYKNVNINITDFEIQTDTFYFYTEKIFFNRTVDIFVNETGIHIESESVIELGDISIAFTIGDWQINSVNANIIIDGSVAFEFKPWGDGFMFCIDTTYFEIQASLFLPDISGFGFPGWLSVNFELTVTGQWCAGLVLG